MNTKQWEKTLKLQKEFAKLYGFGKAGLVSISEDYIQLVTSVFNDISQGENIMTEEGSKGSLWQYFYIDNIKVIAPKESQDENNI